LGKQRKSRCCHLYVWNFSQRPVCEISVQCSQYSLSIGKLVNKITTFLQNKVSATVAVYLVRYDNHWCLLAFKLDDDGFQPEDYHNITS
jgi:hypothetical protein